MITIIVYIICILLVLSIIGVFFKSRTNADVLLSEKIGPMKADIEADMLYYLPAAELQITATASLTVTSTNNVATGITLDQLTLVNTVVMAPDTDHLFKVKFNPSWFSNDEIRVTTGSSGLLETAVTTTDDQLDNIIKELAQAPGQIVKGANFIMGPPPIIAPVAGAIVTTATQTVSRTFYIRQREVKSGHANCAWLVAPIGAARNIKAADAGFKITFDWPSKLKLKRGVAKPQPTFTKKGGLYSRPLTNLTYTLAPHNSKAKASTQTAFEVLVPDLDRAVFIAVERSRFVNRVNTPKFSSGLLVENYLNLPSSFEGLISIPIDLAKSLVSIPSALFNFKIHQKYDQQIADLRLQKSLLDAQKQLDRDNNN